MKVFQRRRNYPTINEALEDFKIGYPSLTNSYRHHDKAEPLEKGHQDLHIKLVLQSDILTGVQVHFNSIWLLH